MAIVSKKYKLDAFFIKAIFCEIIIPYIPSICKGAYLIVGFFHKKTSSLRLYAKYISLSVFSISYRLIFFADAKICVFF